MLMDRASCRVERKFIHSSDEPVAHPDQRRRRVHVLGRGPLRFLLFSYNIDLAPSPSLLRTAHVTIESFLRTIDFISIPVWKVVDRFFFIPFVCFQSALHLTPCRLLSCLPPCKQCSGEDKGTPPFIHAVCISASCIQQHLVVFLREVVVRYAWWACTGGYPMTVEYLGLATCYKQTAAMCVVFACQKNGIRANIGQIRGKSSSPTSPSSPSL